MRKLPIILVLSGACVLLSAAYARAQCPEDPIDSGICDTLYVEV